MTETLTADYTLNLEQMSDYLDSLAERGPFNVALLRENGQGYHAVFHSPNLERRKHRVLCLSGNAWDICHLIKQKFPNEKFEEICDRTVARALHGFDGSVFIEIQQRRIVAVHFHEGALWP